MRQICRKCGSELSREWRYCPVCGTENRVTHPLRQVLKQDEPVSGDDWKLILGLPMGEDKKAELLRLFSSGNKPCEIVWQREINETLIRHGLPFRIFHVRNRVKGRGPTLYQMFKTCPKQV